MNTESQGSKNEDAGDAVPVLTLIKQIKEKKLDPAVLSAEDRRRCVDVLWSEGYAVPEIAQILKRGERTIFRDRTALRSDHALTVHPRFALEMAGDLMRQTECSTARLRRIARDTSVSAMERIMAENFAIKAFVDMISKLQSMGYLPRIPTGVVAQVVGASGGDPIPAYDRIAQRIEELESVDRELGLDDPERVEQRRIIREIVERGRTAAQIDQMIENKGKN